MQELIKKLMDIDKQGGDALMWMYHNKITLLEKEKEVMCEFAYEFETRNNLRSAEQVFDETFKIK